MWTHRTIILPLELADQARDLCMVYDGGHPYETFAELGLSLIEE